MSLYQGKVICSQEASLLLSSSQSSGSTVKKSHFAYFSKAWCYQTFFPGAHKVETLLSQVLILRLSELRPTLGKQLAQGR